MFRAAFQSEVTRCFVQIDEAAIMSMLEQITDVLEKRSGAAKKVVIQRKKRAGDSDDDNDDDL